jgi:hypothetical protein
MVNINRFNPQHKSFLGFSILFESIKRYCQCWVLRGGGEREGTE